MIITRSWLNEWVDLKDITTEELAKTFNSIGLEVDRVESFRVPEGVVAGKVLACEKHPDADKLNVCRVDVGSEELQIVCGASNVRAEQSVAVAVVGAKLPNGMKIKPVKLRGVDSAGMICSSTEIGLPKMEDGIMVLDGSIGDIEPGTPLNENSLLNDDLIEIELTANRGDCLSIRGVARDLCAAFNRELKHYDLEEGSSQVGIGRILKLEQIEKTEVNLRYRAIDLKELRVPLLITLRLAQVEEQKEGGIESLLYYATYNTGVILRAYHHDSLASSEKEKLLIQVKKDENGLASIYGREKASIIGIRQEDSSRVDYSEGIAIIEASYIDPEIISREVSESKIEPGPLFYRTSRGSEPTLDVGLNNMLNLLITYSDSAIYGGNIELGSSSEETVISISIEEINAIVGAEITKSSVMQLLRNLGFNIDKSQGSSFVISVPRYRHDIVNKQDIVEEIVRLVGIDNIPSKPFTFTEENRIDEDFMKYKKRQMYRRRAAQSGFFESVHFIFNERSQLEALGFSCIEKGVDLLNPIAATLDTLRPTLMLSLLNAASHNSKNGQKRIPLFEIGSVFDEQRNESVRLGFLCSGAKEMDSLGNGGKPPVMDFATAVQSVSDVIGDCTLVKNKCSHKLAHPYQSASVVMDGSVVGELFKLHPTVQKAFDLPDTFLCELDFSLLPYSLKEARPFSKYQASFRDLSLVISGSMEYATVEEVINRARNSEIIRFYPVDRYSDETLGEDISLTIRFVLQSIDRTLEEDDITSSMSGVLKALESELGLTLR